METSEWAARAAALGVDPEAAGRCEEVVRAYASQDDGFLTRFARWAADCGGGKHTFHVLGVLDRLRDASGKVVCMPDDSIQGAFALLDLGVCEKVTEAELLHIMNDVAQADDAESIHDAIEFFRTAHRMSDDLDAIQGMAMMARDFHDLKNKPAREHPREQ